MREKSSSVLTSFRRRRLLRCASSSASRCPADQRVRASLSSVLERAEHQGQRRAELVADVGEERRLGAVDLGQRFGAPRSSS